jgi:hypothetical protein
MANRLTFSITPSSLTLLPKASVAVCAHDAGAASHMAAWLAPLQPQLRLCLAGPAVQVFKSRLGMAPSSRHTLEEALDGALVLISGTGWASDLEHQARLLAHQRGIPCVAVLDHWVNYNERFWRDGEEQLPDALWVPDAEAAALAEAAFPSLPVLQLSNHWLEGLCSDVQAIRSNGGSQPRRPARRLLYLLEPIRVPWSQGPGCAPEAGEFQGVRYWLKQLPQLVKQGWVAPQHELEALTLRPHPSEPVGKYDALIAETAAGWPIQLDRASGLAESLAWADAAFGCETQALVAAMACHLTAFSTIPSWAPPCRLPHASLHHLSQLEDV